MGGAIEKKSILVCKKADGPMDTGGSGTNPLGTGGDCGAQPDRTDYLFWMTRRRTREFELRRPAEGTTLSLGFLLPCIGWCFPASPSKILYHFSFARISHRFPARYCQAAVLVAIAIPVFTSQLEKSRESTDLANIRSIYAELATGMLTNDMDQNGKNMKVLNGLTATTTASTGTISIAVPDVPIAQKVAEWQTTSPDVAGFTLSTCPGVTAGTATVTYVFAIDAETTYLSNVTFA